jgi:aspartokinase
VKVLKFGGSSLATPATIREVGRLLLDARRREPVIGVAAFKASQSLLECARLAEGRPGLEDVRTDRAAPSLAVTHLLGSGRAT